MSEEVQHYNIRVFGKVQGVFFRASTQTKAEQMGITGFVRNESDGTVYIEAEGPEDALHRFLDWCEKGPPASRVEEVKASQGKVVKFGNFQIVRP